MGFALPGLRDESLELLPFDTQEEHWASERKRARENFRVGQALRVSTIPFQLFLLCIAGSTVHRSKTWF